MTTKTELIKQLKKNPLTVVDNDIEFCARFIRCYSNNREYKLAVLLHEKILS